jgi:hypothetical protein
MARVVGGHIPGPTMAVTPKSGYTPALNDLVTWDTTANYNVDKCAANENPIGQIIALSGETPTITIEQFCGGCVQVLAYSSAPSLGDKIEVGATANQVQADNSNGVGRVIAVDRVTGYVDVYFE